MCGCLRPSAPSPCPGRYPAAERKAHSPRILHSDAAHDPQLPSALAQIVDRLENGNADTLPDFASVTVPHLKPLGLSVASLSPA
jgi:hypothetical protein